MKGKEIIKALQKEGWTVKRVSGSHHILGKDEETVVVPVHGTKDVAFGTLKAIEKQTGVKLK